MIVKNLQEVVIILKGKAHPFYGKHHTEKAKQAISQNNAMNRPVICIATGDIFRSAAEASRKVGIHPSGIIRCCTGKQKTAAKKEWRYFE